MRTTRTALLAAVASACLLVAAGCSDDGDEPAADDAAGDQVDGAAGGTSGGEDGDAGAGSPSATLTLDGEELAVTDYSCTSNVPEPGDVTMEGSLPDGGSVAVAWFTDEADALGNAFDVSYEGVDRSMFLSQTQDTFEVTRDGGQVTASATIGGYEDGDPADEIVEQEAVLEGRC